MVKNEGSEILTPVDGEVVLGLEGRLELLPGEIVDLDPRAGGPGVDQGHQQHQARQHHLLYAGPVSLRLKLLQNIFHCSDFSWWNTTLAIDWSRVSTTTTPIEELT